jgi:hypothetical protein
MIDPPLASIEPNRSIDPYLVLVLLIKQGMEFVIIWKTANQFVAGLDLMTGLYVLSIAGMVSVLYLKRWVNN